MKSRREWKDWEKEKSKLSARVGQLVAEERWEEGLEAARQLLDEFHSKHKLLSLLLSHVQPEQQQLVEDDTASSWALLGVILSEEPAEDLDRSRARAQECFELAVEKGHLYAGMALAKCYLNEMTRPHLWGAIQLFNFHANQKRAAKLLVRAADSGCEEAFFRAAELLEEGRGVERDLFKAALFYSRCWGGVGKVRHLQIEYPMEVCPFGRWTSEPRLQQLVLPPIRRAQLAWLCVAKRMQMDRNVALHVAAFICTPSGWPDDLDADSD